MKRLTLLFAPLAIAACSGSPEPDVASSAMEARETAAPDPAGSGSDAGARVVFLPPLGDGHADAPLPDVDPVVRIVSLPPAVPTVVAEFSSSGAREMLRVTGNHFLALWDTSSVKGSVVYRVHVLVGREEAGWADVAVVGPGERGRSGTRSVIAGQTLPVKFTISCAGGSCGRPWLERVSVDSDGAEGNGSSGSPAISSDGMRVAFSSDSTNLAAGDTNGVRDVFLRDRGTRTTTRVSILPDGAQTSGMSGMASMSGDGSKIAFMAQSAELCGCGGAAPFSVLVFDVRAGRTQLVSVRADGAPSTQDAAHPTISADGRFVAFSSIDDDIVPGGNWWEDVFVRNLVTGETFVGSLAPDGTPAAGTSGEPSLSADGSRLAFSSSAPNLVAENASSSFDIYVRDFSTGTVVRASVGVGGAAPNGPSYTPRISGDGRKVAFQSLASNLVDGDDNGFSDVFVYDLDTGTTMLVSARADGLPGSGSSTRPSISADGRFVAFQSTAPDLVAGDGNGRADVFVRDLATGVTVRASTDADGADAAGDGWSPALSGNGSAVAFSSDAATLVPSDTNGTRDVFVRRLR